MTPAIARTRERIEPRPAGEQDHAARRHDADRHKGVIGHVHESRPHIDVALAARREQPGRHAIDRRRRGRNHHDGDAGNVAGFDEATHAFDRDRADRHQQQHGIGERRQNGAAPQTIGIGLRGRAPGQHRRGPCHHQPKHVSKVMPCIGDQGHGVREQAVDDFGDDETEIEGSADGEGRAKILWRAWA